MKIEYLRRAIELAEQGRGKCSPNPFVGCVIVNNNKIVGEGFTQPCGKDHAEVQALKQAGEEARGSDLYVTLEPCSHYGKTPPCAKAIIQAGVKQVFIGIKDPNPQVSGKGIALLKEAGVEVTYNLLQEQISRQLECYLTYITKERPFVFVKSAVSIDGKIADQDGNSKWITNAKSREKVHQLRANADAIITGVTTVNHDDAMLNVRLPGYENRDPIRVVLDYDLEIELDKKLVNSASEIKTIIYTQEKYLTTAKVKQLQKHKVEVRTSPSCNNRFLLKDILYELRQDDIAVVMVEAGPQLVSSFVRENLVDKLYYFIAPSLIGGDRSAFQEIGVAKIENKKLLRLDSSELFDGDILLTYYFI